MRVLEEDLERAARLGAELVNAHAGSIPWTDYPPPGLSPAHEALREAERRLREEAPEAFLRLSRPAANLGVALVLENLPAPQEFPRSPEEMGRFLAVEGLGFCLDLGHTRMAGFPPEAFREALGGRLSHLHTDDGPYDLHLPPGPEEVAPFRDFGGSAVGLPPRSVEEYLEVYEKLASTGLVPEAMGGDAG